MRLSFLYIKNYVIQKEQLKIVLHIQINCSTHVDKIILKYRKGFKSGSVTLPKMHHFKVNFDSDNRFKTATIQNSFLQNNQISKTLLDACLLR